MIKKTKIFDKNNLKSKLTKFYFSIVLPVTRHVPCVSNKKNIPPFYISFLPSCTSFAHFPVEMGQAVTSITNVNYNKNNKNNNGPRVSVLYSSN